jgi:hypothetical protein
MFHRSLNLLPLLALALAAGCEGPAKTRAPQSPPPEPRTQEPRDPPPASWSSHSDAAEVALLLDSVGRTFLRSEELIYLVPGLEEERQRFGTGVAVRIEAPPALVWRDVAPVPQACQRVGLRNLHWKIRDDPRPALRLASFTRREVVRGGRVLLGVREGKARYTWSSTTARLRSGDEGKQPPELRLVELLVEVRKSRARRVDVHVADDVPFSVVFETADALRDTGTVVTLSSAR